MCGRAKKLMHRDLALFASGFRNQNFQPKGQLANTGDGRANSAQYLSKDFPLAENINIDFRGFENKVMLTSRAR